MAAAVAKLPRADLHVKHYRGRQASNPSRNICRSGKRTARRNHVRPLPFGFLVFSGLFASKKILLALSEGGVCQTLRTQDADYRGLFGQIRVANEMRKPDYSIAPPEPV